MPKHYDLVILGGGSAGFHAAMTAAKLKKKVCVIEKGPFGGLCILKGCMPSKTLLHSARVVEVMKKAHKVGVYVDGWKVDAAHIVNRKNKIIQGFARGRKEFLGVQKNIDVVYGNTSFFSRNKVRVGNILIEGKHFLISTGSSIFIPDVPGLQETGYITSDEALELKKMPGSIAILGGGPVGVEFAYYFQQMGVNTTIIQRGGHLLSNLDEGVAEVVEKAFLQQGMKLYMNTQLKQFSKLQGKKKIVFMHGKKEVHLLVDEVLVAVGRKPNIAGLQLEQAGVKIANEIPWSNDYLQTSQKHIYVGGDVAGKMPVVNVAVQEGVAAAENMFGKKKRKLDYHLFPMGVFCHPEVAWIGITEKEARAKKLKVEVGKFPFSELGKAVCTDEEEGFIKFIVDKKSKRILGVVIVGHEASDVIHEALPLLYFKATLHDLAKMPHLHPTFGEIFAYLCDEMLEE